ncbi:MAG: calcium-binding protein, partial [bacterium]
MLRGVAARDLVASNFRPEAAPDGSAPPGGGLRIEGGDGDDLLRGGFGNDSLYGGSGDDMISDDDGVSYLDGGEGDD